MNFSKRHETVPFSYKFISRMQTVQFCRRNTGLAPFIRCGPVCAVRSSGYVRARNVPGKARARIMVVSRKNKQERPVTADTNRAGKGGPTGRETGSQSPKPVQKILLRPKIYLPPDPCLIYIPYDAVQNAPGSGRKTWRNGFAGVHDRR